MQSQFDIEQKKEDNNQQLQKQQEDDSVQQVQQDSQYIDTAYKFITFQLDINSSTQLIKQNKYLFYQLNQPGEWILIDGEYNHQYKDILKQIKILRIYRFTLFYNHDPSIIPNISHPIYQNLVRLELAQNKIVNIQSLSFLNAPLMEFLDLRQNRITWFKPLIKIYSFQLNHLRLIKNYYRSGQIFQHLNRTLLSKKQHTLKSLQLYQNYQKNSYNQLNQLNPSGRVQDISGLLKLNINKLRNLKLSNQFRVKNITYRRIRQRRTEQCLKNKIKQQVYLGDGIKRYAYNMNIYY